MGTQVLAADQLQSDGGKAGNRCYAHRRQHQPGIFVLNNSEAFDVVGLCAKRQPDHQDQVGPYPNVPANQYLSGGRETGNNVAG